MSLSTHCGHQRVPAALLLLLLLEFSLIFQPLAGRPVPQSEVVTLTESRYRSSDYHFNEDDASPPFQNRWVLTVWLQLCQLLGDDFSQTSSDTAQICFRPTADIPFGTDLRPYSLVTLCAQELEMSAFRKVLVLAGAGLGFCGAVVVAAIVSLPATSDWWSCSRGQSSAQCVLMICIRVPIMGDRGLALLSKIAVTVTEVSVPILLCSGPKVDALDWLFRSDDVARRRVLRGS